MAASFSVNAVLNVSGPANLGPAISRIRGQLAAANLDLNPRLSPDASRGVAALASQLRSLSGELATARSNAAGLGSALGGLGRSSQAISRGQQQLKGVATATADAARGFRATNDAAQGFGESLGTVTRRFAQFYAVVRVIESVRDAFEQGVREALAFQHEMVRLSQIGGTSARDIGEVSSEITRLSTSLGVSSKDLSGLATTLRQADFAGQEVKTTLEALAKTTLAPTFESVQNTTEGVIALKQQFGVSAREIEGYLGSINTVSGALAVESEDLVTAIRKTGGAFKAASGDLQGSKESFNQLLALFSSVRSTTRESADEISTGLRTIFGRLQSNKVSDNLEKLGINLRFTRQEATLLGRTDLAGQFVGAYEAVRRLSEATRSLATTDPRFAQIATEIGGYRQISRVIPLLQQFGTAERAYAIAQAGANSLTQDAIKSQQSFQVQLTKVKEEFFSLIRTIGDNKAFQGLVTTGLKMAEVFLTVGKALEPILPALTAIAAVKAIQNIGGVAQGFARKVVDYQSVPAVRKAAPSTVRRQQGGVIPGIGRGDHVPMESDPGDFIIRRDAALQFGHQNLDAIVNGRARFAEGGKVPTLLEPQEYYVPRDQARRIGYHKLEYLNRTGRLPGQGQERGRFAAGGRVRPSLHESLRALNRSVAGFRPDDLPDSALEPDYDRLAGRTLGSLDAPASSALEAYRGRGHRINAALRAGRTPREVAGLDRVASSVATPRGAVVYRGLTGPFARQVLAAGRGDEFVDPGFTSATTIGSIARDFAQNNAGSGSDSGPGAVARLHLPRGARAGFVGGMQRELILPRGRVLRYLGHESESEVSFGVHGYAAGGRVDPEDGYAAGGPIDFAARPGRSKKFYDRLFRRDRARWTPDEAAAVRQYTLSTDMLSDRTRGLLDSTLRKSTTPANLVLYRGVDAEHVEAGLGGARLRKVAPGDTYTTGRLTSTSLDPDQARSFGGVMMRLNVPRGAHAAAITANVKEVLLPPASYKVTHFDRENRVLHADLEEQHFAAGGLVATPNPIDLRKHEISRVANNGARTRRYSTDPARRAFYQKHRNARFSDALSSGRVGEHAAMFEARLARYGERKHSLASQYALGGRVLGGLDRAARHPLARVATRAARVAGSTVTAGVYHATDAGQYLNNGQFGVMLGAELGLRYGPKAFKAIKGRLFETHEGGERVGEDSGRFRRRMLAARLAGHGIGRVTPDDVSFEPASPHASFFDQTPSVSREDVLNAAGVLPGSRVGVEYRPSPEGGGGSLHVGFATDRARGHRILSVRDGRIAGVQNDTFGSTTPGSGQASLSYAIQVAHGPGVPIGLTAAGHHGDVLSGYHVFPSKFGADGPIPGDFHHRLGQAGIDAEPYRLGSVQQLLDTPGGAALWERHGSTFDATLDPHHPRVLTALSDRLDSLRGKGRGETITPSAAPLPPSSGPEFVTGAQARIPDYAEALGYQSSRELARRLGVQPQSRAGKHLPTIHEIAAERGVDRSVIDAVRSKATGRAGSAVRAGDVTKADAALGGGSGDPTFDLLTEELRGARHQKEVEVELKRLNGSRRQPGLLSALAGDDRQRLATLKRQARVVAAQVRKKNKFSGVAQGADPDYTYADHLRDDDRVFLSSGSDIRDVQAVAPVPLNENLPFSSGPLSAADPVERPRRADLGAAGPPTRSVDSLQVGPGGEVKAATSRAPVTGLGIRRARAGSSAPATTTPLPTAPSFAHPAGRSLLDLQQQARAAQEARIRAEEQGRVATAGPVRSTAYSGATLASGVLEPAARTSLERFPDDAATRAAQLRQEASLFYGALATTSPRSPLASRSASKASKASAGPRTVGDFVERQEGVLARADSLTAGGTFDTLGERLEAQYATLKDKKDRKDFFEHHRNRVSQDPAYGGQLVGEFLARKPAGYASKQDLVDRLTTNNPTPGSYQISRTAGVHKALALTAVGREQGVATAFHAGTAFSRQAPHFDSNDYRGYGYEGPVPPSKGGSGGGRRPPRTRAGGAEGEPSGGRGEGGFGRLEDLLRQQGELLKQVVTAIKRGPAETVKEAARRKVPTTTGVEGVSVPDARGQRVLPVAARPTIAGSEIHEEILREQEARRPSRGQLGFFNDPEISPPTTPRQSVAGLFPADPGRSFLTRNATTPHNASPRHQSLLGLDVDAREGGRQRLGGARTPHFFPADLLRHQAEDRGRAGLSDDLPLLDPRRLSRAAGIPEVPIPFLPATPGPESLRANAARNRHVDRYGRTGVALDRTGAVRQESPVDRPEIPYDHSPLYDPKAGPGAYPIAPPLPHSRGPAGPLPPLPPHKVEYESDHQRSDRTFDTHGLRTELNPRTSHVDRRDRGVSASPYEAYRQAHDRAYRDTRQQGASVEAADKAARKPAREAGRDAAEARAPLEAAREAARVAARRTAKLADQGPPKQLSRDQTETGYTLDEAVREHYDRIRKSEAAQFAAQARVRELEGVGGRGGVLPVDGDPIRKVRDGVGRNGSRASYADHRDDRRQLEGLGLGRSRAVSDGDLLRASVFNHPSRGEFLASTHLDDFLQDVPDSSDSLTRVAADGSSYDAGRFKSDARKKAEARVQARRRKAQSGPGLGRLIGRRVIAGPQLFDVSDDPRQAARDDARRRSLLEQAEVKFAPRSVVPHPTDDVLHAIREGRAEPIRRGGNPALVHAIREGRADVVTTATGGLVSATARTSARGPSLRDRARSLANYDLRRAPSQLLGGAAFLGVPGASRLAAGLQPSPLPPGPRRSPIFNPEVAHRAAFAGVIAGSYAPQLLEAHFGTVANPTGSRESAKYAQAVGGGVQTAAIGAQLGGAFGPQGALFGGVVGGLVGFVTALKNAREQIAALEFDKLSARFNNALNAVASGSIAANPENVGRVNSGVAESLAEADRRTVAAGDGGNFYDRNISPLLGRGGEQAADKALNSLGVGSAYRGLKHLVGLDAGPNVSDGLASDPVARQKEASRVRQEKAAEVLGPQLASLQQVGSRIASGVKLSDADVQVDSKADAAEFARRRDVRLARFSQAGGQPIAEALAFVQKIPVAEVVESFDRLILATNQQRVAEQANLKAADLAASQLEKFARFGEAIEAASASLHGLRQSSETTLSLASGRVAAPTLSQFSAAGSKPGGLDKDAFGSSVQFFDASVGATGGPLASAFSGRIQDIDKLSRTLPDLITHGVSHGGTGEDTVAGDLHKVLDDVPASLRKQLGLALDSIGGTELSRRAASDPTKLASDLIQQTFGEFKGQFGDTLKGLEARFNEFGQGLQHAAELLEKYDETLDRRSGQGLAVTRARANVQAARTGRDPSDFLSLDQLRAPFVARQRRLAGPRVADASNPVQIATRLTQVRGEIADQERIIQAPGATDQERTRANVAFRSLSGEAENLLKALEHLADTTGEMAAIQEKLNGVEKERAGQLGIARRLATAGPQELQKFAQGAQLATVAAARGTFADFHPEQRGAVLEHLDQFQDVKIPQFGNRTGGQISERLQDDFARRLGLPIAANQRQRLGLLNRQRAVEENGDAALGQLAGVRRDLAGEFRGNLDQRHARGLAAQRGFVGDANLREKDQDLRRAEVGRGNARALERTAREADSAYAEPGVVGDNGLLRAKRAITNPHIAQLRDAQATLADHGQKLREFVGPGGLSEQIDRSFQGTGPVHFLGRSIERPLPGSGESPHDQAERYRKSLLGAAPRLAQQTGLSPEEVDAQLLAPHVGRFEAATRANQPFDHGADLKKSVSDAMNARKGRAQDASKESLRGASSDLFGHATYDQAQETVLKKLATNLPEIGKSLKPLESFRGLDEVTASLKVAEVEYTRALDARAEALKAATPTPADGGAGVVSRAAGGMIYRAGGGPAFAPRGTDTVPAMLTPGEFVVRAPEARKHRGLLEAINAGQKAPAADRAGADPGLAAFARAARLAGNRPGGVDPRAADADAAAPPANPERPASAPRSVQAIRRAGEKTARDRIEQHRKAEIDRLTDGQLRARDAIQTRGEDLARAGRTGPQTVVAGVGAREAAFDQRKDRFARVLGEGSPLAPGSHPATALSLSRPLPPADSAPAAATAFHVADDPENPRRVAARKRLTARDTARRGRLDAEVQGRAARVAAGNARLARLPVPTPSPAPAADPSAPAAAVPPRRPLRGSGVTAQAAFFGVYAEPIPRRSGRGNPAAYFLAQDAALSGGGPAGLSQSQQVGLDGAGYFAGGGFVPRGTDTTPAMLTPGEYVVDRRTAAAHLPALQAMSGKPEYRAGGGLIGGPSGTGSGPAPGGSLALSSESTAAMAAFSRSFQSAVSRLGGASGRIEQAAHSLAQAGESFGRLEGLAAAARSLGESVAPLADAAAKLAQSVAQIKIPDAIKVETNGTFEVLINGAQVIAAIKGDVANQVAAQVLSQLGPEIQKHIREMPVR